MIRQGLVAAVVFVAFAVLAVRFSVVQPVLEAPDETSHVSVVRYIAEHHALPIQRPPEFPAGQEGSQPPLYYALGSILWGFAPTQAIAPTFHQLNPLIDFSRLREPLANRNLYAHTPREGFPYQGDVLGIHLVRLLSVLLGCLTVALTFLLARELWPERPFAVLLAPMIVAFDPQFAFMSGVVNNDDLIATAASFVLWCLVRWLRRGGSPSSAITLGVGLGLAILAKTSGLLLVPLAALVFLHDLADFSPWPRLLAVVPRLPRRRTLRYLGVVAITAVAVSGWWFVRNQILYGDPLGWAVMLESNGSMVRTAPLSLIDAARRLWDARSTAWGIFGWTNVVFPDRVYTAFDVASGVAVIGCLLAAVRWLRSVRRGAAPGDRPVIDTRRTLAVLLVAGWPFIVFVSLVRWLQLVEAADQWRLMFPAFAAFGVLLALGVDEILGAIVGLVRSVGPRPIGRPAVAAGLALALVPFGLAGNLLVIDRVVAPEYYPNVVASAPSESGRSLLFGKDVELIDYQVQPMEARPGGKVQVDLYWRAIHPMTENWLVSMTVLDEGENRLDRVQSWPDGGRAPTSAWQPGEVIHDQYTLTPVWESPEPQLGAVWLDLYSNSTPGGINLPVTTLSGGKVGDGVRLASIKLPASTPESRTPSVALSARFGSAIELRGYERQQSGDTLQVTLYWAALGQPSEDDTVFVHILDSNGKLVGQHDSPPRLGRYPTHLWAAGETLTDVHPVSLAGLPPGTYRVVAGLYNPKTGVRLAPTDTSATIVDGSVLLEALRIP